MQRPAPSSSQWQASVAGQSSSVAQSPWRPSQASDPSSSRQAGPGSGLHRSPCTRWAPRRSETNPGVSERWGGSAARVAEAFGREILTASAGTSEVLSVVCTPPDRHALRPIAAKRVLRTSASVSGRCIEADHRPVRPDPAQKTACGRPRSIGPSVFPIADPAASMRRGKNRPIRSNILPLSP